MGDSGFWKKLKILFTCIYKTSLHDKQTKNDDDDEVIDAVQNSSTNSNSVPPRSPIDSEISYYSHLKQFTYHELELATKNFVPELYLGEGGFGSVFKGWITHNDWSPSSPGIGMPIAVKSLNKQGKQGQKEWEAEINHLGGLRHPNLVKLLGYCNEDEHRMLVYEFMPRGSLENHLFRSERARHLTWALRMKIMYGAAKGLAFLHEESPKPIIYRDFKTSNVLLDLHYNAKLSDFGLARDAPEGDKTHVSTEVIGTQGYAAPEYVMTGHLTLRSDVYSFGVVLLEMITGRKAFDKKKPQKEKSLVEWAKTYLKYNEGIYQMIDPNLEGEFSPKGVHRALKIVAHCVYRDPRKRPLMSEVANALETIMTYNDKPCSPLPQMRTPGKGVDFGPSSSKSARHGGDGGVDFNKYGLRVGSSSSASSSRNTPTRFFASPLNFTPYSTTPTRFQGSPIHFTPPFPLPTPPRDENENE